ncbi:NUDIX domain protein [Pseudooceanicola marinus]|uniref:NUDIX domain protein n=1 Tax=Pseudooceanicola marinus TaxID=396013 RepID=A0A1X6YZK6_9RHOB|nr:NUDIX hydrolase [Pseudooceanicola marinus]PJE32525.1 NUDIX domain-containing protein [Pseudooceanicola marinus]SLN36442.1 NUDIX domain protein [Pseudooceanicola marinus]
MSALVQTSFQIPGTTGKEVQTQYCALCYRIVKDKPQILLITSRGTKRWILPKGWPMKSRTPGQAALREAYEEAGVIGRVSETALGLFPYMKTADKREEIPCVGIVYPVHVRLLKAEYPEAGERKRKWFSRKKAAKQVAEPELARILKTFDPSKLRN